MTATGRTLLIASSPDYDDFNAVGVILDATVDIAGGELITLLLAHQGGACAIARQIVETSPDSGLSWEMWDGGLADETYVWLHDEVPPPVELPNGPRTTFSNSLGRSSFRPDAEDR